MTNERILKIARIFLRIALGVTFLVAVADRFGWLGHYGSKNVSWGDWNHFVQYAGVLNWFVPRALINGLAAVETTIEYGLGFALLLGVYPRLIAWSSAGLLMFVRSDDEHCSQRRCAIELFGVFGRWRGDAPWCG